MDEGPLEAKQVDETREDFRTERMKVKKGNLVCSESFCRTLFLSEFYLRITLFYYYLNEVTTLIRLK